MTTALGLWDMLDGWQQDVANPRTASPGTTKKPRGVSRDGKTARERVRDGGGSHT
jgi:hypothetical protein